MPAGAASKSFLKSLQASSLLERDELDAFLAQCREQNLSFKSDDGIAALMVQQDRITRWQADRLLKGRYKGFFIGPYCLLSLLGHGGMSMVYLARHRKMRRLCAIKILPAKFLDQKTSVLERFYLEAQAVAALDHANIVRAYDVNQDFEGEQEIHYFVMEYVEGQDLYTRVTKEGPMEFTQAAQCIRQAACGLQHAHENGLVHRDIKPGNLLLDQRGSVKVLDLGLARFNDEIADASLTSAYNESLLGTADYVSPEQAINSHDVDARTDIYSLGCTFYFLLTGQPPFPEGSLTQRLLAHQTEEPAPLQTQRPDVPVALVAIIDGMMAKKPQERFQAAHELVEILGDWLQESKRPVSSSLVVEDENLAVLEVTPEVPPTPPETGSSGETELGLAPFPEEVPEEQFSETAEQRSQASDELELGLAPLDDEIAATDATEAGVTETSDLLAAVPGQGMVPIAVTGPPAVQHESTELTGVAEELQSPVSEPLDVDQQLAQQQVAHAGVAVQPLDPLDGWQDCSSAQPSQYSLGATPPRTGGALHGNPSRSLQPAVRSTQRIWVYSLFAVASLLTFVVFGMALHAFLTRDTIGGSQVTDVLATGDGTPEDAVITSGDGAVLVSSDDTSEMRNSEPKEPAQQTSPPAPSASAETVPREAAPLAATGKVDAGSPAPTSPVSASPAPAEESAPQPGLTAPVDAREMKPEGVTQPVTDNSKPGVPESNAEESVTSGLDPATARLAQLNTIVFSLESSIEQASSKYNIMVQRAAIESAKKLNLQMVAASPNVLYLKFEVASVGNFYQVSLAARLKGPDDAFESENAADWTRQEVLGNFKASIIKGNSVPAKLRTKVTGFFRRFEREVKAAKDRGQGN